MKSTIRRKTGKLRTKRYSKRRGGTPQEKLVERVQKGSFELRQHDRCSQKNNQILGKKKEKEPGTRRGFRTKGWTILNEIADEWKFGVTKAGKWGKHLGGRSRKFLLKESEGRVKQGQEGGSCRESA